jgi:hypothetical protein
MTPEPDYSTYTLQQLLAARQWSDAAGPPDRKSWLEDEIRKRYARFQDAAKHLGPTSRSATQYRPWGSIFGSAALAVCIGPMLVSQLLDTIGFIGEDHVLLWDVWALLTLPIAVIVFLIGGIKDVERVGKWFHR